MEPARTVTDEISTWAKEAIEVRMNTSTRIPEALGLFM
jgi:hypothetical protein